MAAFVAALTAAGWAAAEEPKSLGAFEKWTSYAAGPNGQLVCYVYSEPLKQEGDYSKRGAVYVQVANRQKDKVKGELSVTAGYPYKPDSETKLDIDGTEFTLFTKDQGAWARDIKTEGEIVQAMRAGRRMIVRGTSTRGTQTTDTYSLTGFTAAMNAIDQACGVK